MIRFSSEDDSAQAIVDLIGTSAKSVHVAVYSFTSKPIAQALVDARKRGVDIGIVLDKSNATARYSAATFLANSGIPARINRRYAIMHN